jgi:hypothetical protein
MAVGTVWRRVLRFFVQPHGPVKSFEREVEAGGGVVGRTEGGMKTVPTRKVVGSVGRWQNLRSDFFYVSGKVTGRFVRIGKAMEAGTVLPPIEVYKAKLRRRQGKEERDVTEYYVVDGHHRVAMARKLGQDYLDAHVVEYKVGSPAPEAPPAPETPELAVQPATPAAHEAQTAGNRPSAGSLPISSGAPDAGASAASSTPLTEQRVPAPTSTSVPMPAPAGETHWPPSSPAPADAASAASTGGR